MGGLLSWWLHLDIKAKRCDNTFFCPFSVPVFQDRLLFIPETRSQAAMAYSGEWFTICVCLSRLSLSFLPLYGRCTFTTVQAINRAMVPITPCNPRTV